MEEKNYCPKCGHVFVQGEYEINYETGNTDYHCPDCDWEGTHYNVMNVDNVLDDLEDIKDEYELDGVEITTGDAEAVIMKVVEEGEEYNDALRQVLSGIRECLDEGLEEIEDENDLSDKLEMYDGDYADGYVDAIGCFIMRWPDSQELMDKPNFWEHAKLINDEEGLEVYGSSAYVVEKAWWKEVSGEEF